MSHLQKLNCRCEVTAVKFICDGNFLLTSQGPFLSIYDAMKGIYIDSCQILCANKIHGIHTHSILLNLIEYTIIICFGGRELSISIFNPNNKTINTLHSPLLLNDWIFDTKLLKTQQNVNATPNTNAQTFELAIGMMHNQVLIYKLSLKYDIKAEKSKISLLYSYSETILSENTSILYSLTFYGTKRNNLMIAAGDCFNHLLLWNVFETETVPNSKTKHTNKSKIKFRGRRKGAIHDISWSSNGKYLCYVSDDRSVQLWKFTDSKSLQMLYRVYGHQARVFKCWISSNAEYVVSISEDSTCRVWNFDGDLIDVFEFRYGQIWSLDICYKQIRNKNVYHVALGGADSSIRFHYFLSSKQPKPTADINTKTISLSTKKAVTNTELIPFKHHIDAKVFYQINLPNKYFPHQSAKKKNRGKKRNNTNVIRMMTIDKNQHIIFATATDIYRVSKLSAVTELCKWEHISSLKKIFSDNKHDEITTMQICNDLFSDYGHYPGSRLFANVDVTFPEEAQYGASHEQKTALQRASQASLRTLIKQTDYKIAENLHLEYQRWLIIGTKVGRVSIIDLTSKQIALSFRAHDIGIISLYSCITCFQPETLRADITANDAKRPEHTASKLRTRKMRFSVTASELHTMRTDPVAIDQYIKQTGNSSLMLFTSDGNGNITYWCFPLAALQKPSSTLLMLLKNNLDDVHVDDDVVSAVSSGSNASSVSVKFDAMRSALKSRATFLNPAKKQICAFCYLPPPKDILIVGDSRGSIMLFSLLSLEDRERHKPMQVLKEMHGREPVSCIKALCGIKYIHDRHRRQSLHDMDEKYHIVSGGKDGKIVEYTFVDRKYYIPTAGGDTVRKSGTGSGSSLKSMVNVELINDDEVLMPVRPIASTSLSAVDDIIVNERGEMICTGFRSTDFIVWNCKQDYVLFRWNCGGVKRPHDFSLLHYDEKEADIDTDGGPPALSPCRGWIFAYTNTNISNAIAVFHLDLPLSIPLGSLRRPYHSSEIHALHWLLSPNELYEICKSKTDDTFVDIEDFVSESETDRKIDECNKPLSAYFSKLMLASSGEDGLIQIVSILNGNTRIQSMSTTTAASNVSLTHSRRSSVASRRNSAWSDKSGNVELRAKLSSLSMDNDWKYANAFDEEMYPEWILKFAPERYEPLNVINLVRENIMEQNAGSRFPLKCCDMVRKSSGDAYLFFAGGAKQYLQGYEVTYNENKPEAVEWKSLCCTGGDTLREKQRGKRWKKPGQMMQDRINNMDLRIKSCVVIPSPKYYGKWLIVTGNSRGTIRCYTFDEEKPSEFQFEGEDSVLHKDHNASSPILSLSSTYSSETCYHFPSVETMLFSPFNHTPTAPTHSEKTVLSPLALNKGNVSPSPSPNFSATSQNSQSHTSVTQSQSRVISGYFELPPHLIFSGATDGWIRIWFWDIDSHSIQLVGRLMNHQNGVNAISATWLDVKFLNKKTVKTSSPNPNESAPVTVSTGVDNGLLTRRLAILTGGDDQSLTLIIADFESTMSLSRASRKRAKSRTNVSQSGQQQRQIRATGWKFKVIREIAINTAHIASIRSVAITPIITPGVVQCFGRDRDCGLDGFRMNEMLLVSTGDDQRLRCWTYKFEKRSFHSGCGVEANVELLAECELDIGLPNVLSMYYIYNSGILLCIAGQGIQIVTLPFDKYLFKKIYYNKEVKEEYRKRKDKEYRNDNEDNRSVSFESSFSQNVVESVSFATVTDI